MLTIFRKLLGLKKRYSFISGAIQLYYWEYSDEEAYMQLKQDCPNDYVHYQFLE
jgi:hypothetical protein